MTLSGTKFLDGRDLTTGEFTFEVYEGSTATGTPILTATNEESGDYAFTPILNDMTDLGLHTYTVVEKTGSLGGIDYDDTAYTVQVDVSDNGDGTLHIVKSENYDDLDFENTYTSTGSLEMSGKKTLTGRALASGEFVFELFEGTDTPVPRSAPRPTRRTEPTNLQRSSTTSAMWAPRPTPSGNGTTDWVE